jgi:hypothetical protein
MSPIPGWAALRSRWAAVAPRRKAILALILVFVVGIGGGALIEDVADELDFDRPLFSTDRDHDDLDDDGDDSEETLLANFDLTPEQRTSIERIFEAREDRLEAYWDAQLPQLEVLIDSSRDEIRNLLTPDQRASYDSQVARLRLHSRHDLDDEDDDD